MTETENKKTNVKRTIQCLSNNITGIHAQIISSLSGLEMTVGNVVGIGEFSGNETVLLLKRGSIVLKGDLLEIGVFEDNTVEIRGRIENIEFKYPRARGRGYGEA